MAFQFGVGTLQVSGSTTFTIAKLQNVSINIGYENTQLRGGVEVFGCDTQFFDGSVEGSIEYADIELSQIGLMLGGTGAFAGAGGSGTVTLTGNSRPNLGPALKMVLTTETNGITSTVTLQRVYIPSLTLDFARTEYTVPNLTFVCEASTATGLLTWQQ